VSLVNIVVGKNPFKMRQFADSNSASDRVLVETGRFCKTMLVREIRPDNLSAGFGGFTPPSNRAIEPGNQQAALRHEPAGEQNAVLRGSQWRLWPEERETV